MKAKTYLTQIRKLDCMIEHKRSEQEQWMARALATSPSYDFDVDGRPQTCGNHQRMANAVVNSVFVDSEIERTLEALCAARKQIISVIEQLAAAEYDLLHKVYVGSPCINPQTGQRMYSYMTLQEVAMAADRSYSWATHIHSTALRHVQRIIDAQQLKLFSSY